MHRFARIPCRPLGFAPWLAALAWISTAGVAFAAERTNPRWAIVSVDPLGSALADLLTPKLSQWTDVELVERDAIDKVLKELDLAAGGLAEAERSMQFGRLVAADALLLIERREPAGGSSQRIRLIETRTGIRLLDTRVLEKDLEQEVTAVLQALHRGQRKLTAGTARRHYVGVLGLHSEEPGAALTGPCRALTTLLEVDLQSLPNVVVLEREQLRRLTAERDLSGVELQLRGSAWLIEAGLRRTGVEGALLITGKLQRLAGGTSKDFRVTSSVLDPNAMRRPLLQEVAKSLDEEMADAPLNADAQTEAAFFARRSDWYRASGRLEEAEAAAETALALDPTDENLWRALAVYFQHGEKSSTGVWSDASVLEAARRFCELRLDSADQAPDPGRRLQRLRYRPPLEPDIPVPRGHPSHQIQQLYAECDRLRLETFERVYQAADESEAIGLLGQRLQRAKRFAQSDQQYADTVLWVLREWEQAVKRQAGAPSARRSPYGEFTSPYGLFVAILSIAIEGGEPRLRSDAAAAVWRILARHSDAGLQVAGLAALMVRSDDEGLEMAHDVSRRVLAAASQKVLPQEAADHLLRAAHLRLRRAGEFEPAYETLLCDAERQGSARYLLGWPRTVVHGLMDGGNRREAVANWGNRILTLLAASEFQGYEAGKAAGMRSQIADRLRVIGVLPATPFEAATAPGAWKDYTTRPIQIKPRSWQNGPLHGVAFDPPATGAQDEDLVLVWGRGIDSLVVERLSLRDGSLRPIGSPFPGAPSLLGRPQVAAAGDGTLFVTSADSGITAVREYGFEVFDQTQGVPGDVATCLAWLDGRLYVAYRGALGCFDPLQRRFELLASAKTLEPRHPLDGGANFRISQMFPDPAGHCLWLEVDNGLGHAPDEVRGGPRAGLWRLVPATARFERVVPGMVLSSWCQDRTLLVYDLVKHQWVQVDSVTGESKPLVMYARFPADRVLREPRFIKVSDHIVTSSGELYTPDGKTHPLPEHVPWTHFLRAGWGFLTNYDRQANAFWYVERKRAMCPRD
jgi:tetratricopeptide (TPR) repeat protein